MKELHRALHDFTDDQLKQIPVLAGGTRLEQGATYIDLRGSEPREFTATADMAAGPGDWYVPKTEVPYDLWNRLLAVGNRETGGGRGQAA